MERETIMLYRSFLLLFFNKIPKVIFVVELIVLLHDAVKKVIIEVTRAGALQARLEFLFGKTFRRHRCRKELGRKGIAVPGVAVYQSLADGILRTRIYERCIKISESRIKEDIDHL